MLSEEGKRKVEQSFGFAAQMAEFFGVKKIARYSAPEIGCVYAFEMSDNTVKIGVTRDPDKRVKNVKCAVYLEVKRTHVTGYAPLKFMRKIERRCHEAFDIHRVRGEYFDITFEEAVAELEKYAEEISNVMHTADQNFIDEFNYYEELREKYFPSNNVAEISHEPSDTPAKKTRKVSSTACVYAMLMSNGTVKIGHSVNVNKSRSNIQSKYKLTVEKIYSSTPIPRKIARSIEKAWHNFYSPCKVEGEFFSAKFEEVCRLIDTFVKHDEGLPLVTDVERADKILKIAEKINDNAKKQVLLLKAADIFVGESSD